MKRTTERGNVNNRTDETLRARRVFSGRIIVICFSFRRSKQAYHILSVRPDDETRYESWRPGLSWKKIIISR